MFTCKEQFDLSDMKIEKFKDSEYKKVVGKFKDETQGIPICEFIGLRSKMYSVKLDDDSEKKTAKGIVRNVIKNQLKHAQYKHILDTGERMTSSMKMIRSFDHDIYTVNDSMSQRYHCLPMTISVLSRMIEYLATPTVTMLHLAAQSKFRSSYEA